MSSAIFWAIVAAVLALRLTPLWGIVVGVLAAVIGVVANVSMVAASGSVLLATIGGSPGMAGFARTCAVVILGACAVGAFVVGHMIITGSRPLSGR